MPRNQQDPPGCIIDASHVELAPRVQLTKEMSGRSLRGRSAQAQVQVRGYKEEKLELAVRTLCFICLSYRSLPDTRTVLLLSLRLPHFPSRYYPHPVAVIAPTASLRTLLAPPRRNFRQVGLSSRRRTARRWVATLAPFRFRCVLCEKCLFIEHPCVKISSGSESLRARVRRAVGVSRSVRSRFAGE